MPDLQTIATRTVTPDLQERFAALTGDRNPMHMDPVAARRTQAGLPVVHGVHTLLWCLEELLAANLLPAPLAQIKVRFQKWVYLGDEAVLRFAPAEDPGDPAQLQVEVLGMSVLTADLFPGTAETPAASTEQTETAAIPEPRTQALDRGFSGLEDASANVFVAPSEATRLLFPLTSAALGAPATAEMAACSYVVGMEAPGLHSMFSRLDLRFMNSDLRFTPSSAEHGKLHYTVTSVDERFRKVRIAVEGSAVRGTLEAFLRNPPTLQASIETLASRVTPNEFAHWRALVVGGSRGLGELTAKLIAAGGGTPVLTWAVGKSEAEAVAQAIRSAGHQAETLPYDVRQAPAPQLASAGAFTHVLYFATNAIFRPKGALVTPHILADFLQFYVQGFHDLVLELTRTHPADTTAPLVAYYPSSVAVDLTQRPEGMTEYAMIKAAGELMCLDMERFLPNLRIFQSRLPRLPTDQTAGVVPGRDLDPTDVLLPILRDMQELTTGSQGGSHGL